MTAPSGQANVVLLREVGPITFLGPKSIEITPKPSKIPLQLPNLPNLLNLLATSFFPVSPRYSTVTSSTFLVDALALFHNSGADLLSTLILFQTRESQKDQWVRDPYCTPYTCRGWSWGAALRILHCSILTIYYGVYGVLRMLLLFTIMVQPSTCLASTYLDIQVSLE